MTVRKRGKIYYLDLPDPDAPGGRYKKSTGLTDQVSARILHDRKKVEIANRRLGLTHLIPPKAVKISLSEFQKEYAASRTHLSKRTLEIDDYAFGLLIDIIGDVAMDSITVMNLRKFKAAILKDRSSTTFNICRQTLSAAFNFALKWGGDWGYITSNPFNGFPKVRVNKKSRRSLSGEELIRLFGKILSDKNTKDQQKFADLMTIYLILGLRRNEGLSLTPNEVDWDRNFIHVKERKGKEDEYLPLTPEIISIFLKYKKGKYEPFFNYTPDNVTKRFKRYAERAKIDGVSPHSLRHTVATLALTELNQNPEAVKELLGHKDIRTTMAYVHADPSLKVGIVTALNDLVGGYIKKAKMNSNSE